MDEEIELLLADMEQVQNTVKAGITFRTGQLNGKQIVVCKSGVGKVNAAVCSQILIDRFAVEGILFLQGWRELWIPVWISEISLFPQSVCSMIWT